MTPLEQSEYKRAWRKLGICSVIHSDLHIEAKAWLRKHCERWEWSMDTYTDVYAHTVWFEHVEHREQFCKHFAQWIQA